MNCPPTLPKRGGGWRWRIGSSTPATRSPRACWQTVSGIIISAQVWSIRRAISASWAVDRATRNCSIGCARLLDDGWRLKPLQRLIVTSETYRQASTYREAAARVDGASRLLWRFPPRRLAAEEVRDTMLAVAGLLDTKMGGPGFKLYTYYQDNVATYVPLDRPGPETYRRSVYHHSARASYLDVLTDFDCPDNAFGAPRRASTTTPLQALDDAQPRLRHRRPRMPSPTVCAATLGAVPHDQITRAFALAYGRAPTGEEAVNARRLIDQHGLNAFCRALLNTNEIISLD